MQRKASKDINYPGVLEERLSYTGDFTQDTRGFLNTVMMMMMMMVSPLLRAARR